MPAIFLRCLLGLLLSGIVQPDLVAAADGGQSFEKQMDKLLAGKAGDEAQRESIARRMQGDERLLFVTLNLELYASASKRVAVLLPLLENRRELAARVPQAVCSLAMGLIENDNAAQAEQVLALLPDRRSALVQADEDSVQVYAALHKGNDGRARSLLRSARYALKRAVPDKEYASWHSRLIERRLNRLERVLKRDAAEDLGGPAYLAWLQAERSGKHSDYQSLIEEFDETVYASAARLVLMQRLVGKDPEACLSALSDMQRDMEGPLASQFLMLAGDAWLLSGELAKAKTFYGRALKASTRPSRSAFENFSDTLITKLLPSEPLHRKDRWNYPIWEARPSTCILAGALREDIAALHRYQIIVRQATMYFLAGKRSMASQLARTLLAIDAVDRQMDKDKDGAGARVLAHTLESLTFIIPLENFNGVNDTARACLLMSVSHYQVYDWRSARQWALRGLKHLQRNDRRARVAAHALLACIEQMRHKYKEAMAYAGNVQLERGDKPHQAWFIARQVEWEIYQHTPEDYEAAVAVFNTIRRQAPGTRFAMKALLFQATYVSSRDPATAVKLFELFKSKYPDLYPEAIAYHLADAHAALQLQESEPAP